MAEAAKLSEVDKDAPAFETWRKPDGVSLSDWLENSRVARFEERTYDWDALKFQADYDPKYRRSQMRYIGLGAAVQNRTVMLYHPKILHFLLWFCLLGVKGHPTFTTMLRRYSLCCVAVLDCFWNTMAKPPKQF